MKEAWWIDYMEGEMPNQQAEEMEMVLRFSKTDREILGNLRKVRKRVKDVGNVEMPGEDFMMKLENDIMEAVRQSKMEKPQRPQRPSGRGPKRVIKRFLKKAMIHNARKMRMAQLYFSFGN